MLVTSGVAHLPPIKVVTILAGVIGVNLALFIVLGDRRARRPLPASWPGCCAAMASRSATSSRSGWA